MMPVHLQCSTPRALCCSIVKGNSKSSSLIHNDFMPEASKLDQRFFLSTGTCSEQRTRQPASACLKRIWCHRLLRGHVAQVEEPQQVLCGISSFVFPTSTNSLSSFNYSTPERRLQLHLYCSQPQKGNVKHQTTIKQPCSVPVMQQEHITQQPACCSRVFQCIPSGVKKTTDEKRNPSTSPIKYIQNRTDPNLHQLATRKSPPIIPATAVKIRRTEKEKGKFQHLKLELLLFSSFTYMLDCYLMKTVCKKPNKSIRICFMYLISAAGCN